MLFFRRPLRSCNGLRREINSKRTNKKFFSWLGVSERNFSINMPDCVGKSKLIVRLCWWTCEMIRRNNTSKKCYTEKGNKNKLMRPRVSKEIVLSRHLINDVINSRLREARHELVDDFLHKHVRHAGAAALGQLE